MSLAFSPARVGPLVSLVGMLLALLGLVLPLNGNEVQGIVGQAHGMRNEMRFWLRCFHRLIQCSGFLLTSDQKYLCLMKKEKQRRTLFSQITDELHLVAHPVGNALGYHTS